MKFHTLRVFFTVNCISHGSYKRHLLLQFYLVSFKMKKMGPMCQGAEVTPGRGDSGAEVIGAEVSGAEMVGADVTRGRSD